MAKRKSEPVQPIPEPVTEPEVFEDDATPAFWGRSPLWVRIAGGATVATMLVVGSFELVYAGKVFPGVTANGAELGGLSRDAATKRVNDRTKTFQGQVVTITEGDTNLRIPVAGLGVSYDTAQATDLAYRYGREGNWYNRARQQMRALLGRSTDFRAYKFSDERLIPYVNQLAEDIVTPVADASLTFDSDKPQVAAASGGARLDVGRLIELISDRIGQASADPIPAPVYSVEPMITTAALGSITNQLGDYVAGPITLTHNGDETIIDQKTIISWIEVGAKPTKNFMFTRDLVDLYPLPASASVGLSRAAVTKYVEQLAASLDQTPANAGLAMKDGALAIVQPSRTGIKLDQSAATDGIVKALNKTGSSRSVTLSLATTQADVNESNLDSLGIKEQLSQGETYFPGSPSTRLTNVRAGARRFNGVLLKPGETFSFGKLLGEVGPQTGYVPELVILGDHEEKQYGGGLCQVSSTAFRAALAAGLPITERVNHSFAISYYTWPYAAPGVDATIYYPAVDFKFVNDTGSYILMQTYMSGVDLKFDFFGTKKKTGVVRGPSFITGSSDATVPSHTVFYRDVLDLSGKVIKTDTFHTYYKSSKDFPVTQQFN